MRNIQSGSNTHTRGGALCLVHNFHAMFSDLSQFECNISFGFCRPHIGQIIMDKLKDELAKSTALPVGKYLIKTTYQ